MPDVKVYMPVWACKNELFVADLIERLQMAVAAHLECEDYEGKPVGLTPDQVDVMTFAYGEHDKVGATLIIEVCAYDYADRMLDIGRRMEDILDQGIPPETVSVNGQKKASISFIPIPKGSWKASKS
jgi:hypothetical protein